MASTVAGRSPGATARPTRVTGRRVAAGLLDVIVLGAVFTALALAVGDSDTSGSSVSLHLGGGPALLWLVIVAAYYFVPEWLAGRTLGKAAFGLLVVVVSPQNQRIGDLAARTVVVRG
jgi:uncharacterized RDD family membrane protein YckC